MKTLLRYLGNLKEYLVFSFLILTSFILIFQNDNLQVKFMRVIAVSVIGSIQNGFSFVPNVFELQRENKKLRENNIDLSNQVSDLKEYKLENLRLNQLLQFKQSHDFTMTSARIIGKTLIQTRNNITLNVGENDSVRMNMPVITDKGLVGKIVAVSDRFSIAQIMLNKDLRVSAKDQRSRVDGIIGWEGGDRLIMKNVAKSSDVLVGDVIITSEYSNVFPPGLPIGFVTAVGTVDNLFKKIDVEPFVAFETLEEVFVLRYIPVEERNQLEKKFNDRYK